MTQNLADNVRIYAQLKPLEVDLAHLIALRSCMQVNDRARKVAARQLHMTLIHFGKVREIFATLHALTGITHAQFAAALSIYLEQTTACMQDQMFTLRPAGFSLFGQRSTVLVIEYVPTGDLIELHKRLLRILQDFFVACGVPNVMSFMLHDRNFMFALSLKPHITLFKNYSGSLTSLTLEPVTLGAMPTLYYSS